MSIENNQKTSPVEAEKEPKFKLWRVVLDSGEKDSGIVSEVVARTKDEARQKGEKHFGVTMAQRQAGTRVFVEEMTFDGYDVVFIPKK